MGLKSLLMFFLVVGVLCVALLLYLCPELYTEIQAPDIPDGYYGRGVVPSDPDQFPKDNTEIKKFQIKIQDSVIEDLKARLNSTRFVEPLDNTEFQYGFHATYLKEIVGYWKTKYNWRKQEQMLNKFSHFTTQIEGINVHFIHEKPKVEGRKIRVLPLLMTHGWPGSIVEFTNILPLLTTPQQDRDYVFEVICPSIPGYGFSEAPHQPGFSTVSAARVFSKLMDRLGIRQFYVQGGDWGSLISLNMGKLYPKRILGVHTNIVPVKTGVFGTLKYALGYFVPSLFGISPEDYSRVYGFGFMLQESGYLHIQATKPDTVAAALTDSPSGLAAYILEKFSTWTNRAYRELKDGGLTKKYTLDHLLTNVMVYWCTNSIASSARFYKESFHSEATPGQKMSNVPLKVPLGISEFPEEITLLPRSFLSPSFKYVVYHNRLPKGGHFAAMEEPELLAGDIWDFVVYAEKLNQKEKEEL